MAAAYSSYEKKKERIKLTLQWTKNTKVKAFKSTNGWPDNHVKKCIFIGMVRVPWKLFHMTASFILYVKSKRVKIQRTSLPWSETFNAATISASHFGFLISDYFSPLLPLCGKHWSHPLSCPSKLLNRISNLSRRSVTAVWPSPSGFFFLVRSSLAEIVDCGRAGVCPANERNFLYWRTESRRKRRGTEMVSESSEYPIQYSHVGSPTAWKVSKATFTSHYFYY